jgi:hypothetical protein
MKMSRKNAGVVRSHPENHSADFAKGEHVALLRPGYKGRTGRVLTKDKSRIIVNVERGFVVSVLPSELQRRNDGE